MTTKSEDSSLRETYLIQRLEKPWDHPGILGADNPFSFGGGYVNGGLSKDAMALLRPIFGFEYMGSAEFEFGAVPEALTVVAKQADAGTLVAFSFDIALSDVQGSWREPKGYKPPKGEKRTVYVLCRDEWAAEVETRIREIAKKGHGYRLKESANLSDVLRPDPTPDRYERRTGGWLELNNGFLFFTDEAMWKATADLFGVATSEDSASVAS